MDFRYSLTPLDSASLEPRESSQQKYEKILSESIDRAVHLVKPFC